LIRSKFNISGQPRYNQKHLAQVLMSLAISGRQTNSTQITLSSAIIIIAITRSLIVLR